CCTVLYRAVPCCLQTAVCSVHCRSFADLTGKCGDDYSSTAAVSVLICIFRPPVPQNTTGTHRTAVNSLSRENKQLLGQSHWARRCVRGCAIPQCTPPELSL
ncbi:unnamed protein product, partial [Sphacelaria rigidula]